MAKVKQHFFSMVLYGYVFLSIQGMWVGTMVIENTYEIQMTITIFTSL